MLKCYWLFIFMQISTLWKVQKRRFVDQVCTQVKKPTLKSMCAEACRLFSWENCSFYGHLKSFQSLLHFDNFSQELKSIKIKQDFSVSIIKILEFLRFLKRDQSCGNLVGVPLSISEIMPLDTKCFFVMLQHRNFSFSHLYCF